jgi:hypothetical protein
MTSLFRQSYQLVNLFLVFVLLFFAHIQSGFSQTSQLEVTAIEFEEGFVNASKEMTFEMIEILYPDLTVGGGEYLAANVVREDNINRLLIYKHYAGSDVYVALLSRYGRSTDEIWAAGSALGNEVITAEYTPLFYELTNAVRALGYSIVNNTQLVPPEGEDNSDNTGGSSDSGSGNSSDPSATRYGIAWCEGEFKTTESAPWTSGTLVSPNFRILASDNDMTDEEIIFYFKRFANYNTLMEIAESANCQVRTYTDQSLYDGYRDSISGPVIETLQLNIMSRDI